MKISRTLLTLLALLGVAVLTQGHSDDHHHHEKRAKHGGQYVEFEGHHGIEMVAGETSVGFHLSEGTKPMDVSGGSFEAVIQTPEGTKLLPLNVSGATASGDLEAPLPKGAKVAFSGKDATGHAIQARFVLE